MSMAKRATTRHACTTCREKRRKCDGSTPCSACEARGQECAYADKSWKSKGSLRSEIDQLRRNQRDNDLIMAALRSTDRWADTLQSLQRGDSISTITRRMSDAPAGMPAMEREEDWGRDAAAEDDDNEIDDATTALSAAQDPEAFKFSLDEPGRRKRPFGSMATGSSSADRTSDAFSPLFGQSISSLSGSAATSIVAQSEHAQSTPSATSESNSGSSDPMSGEISFVRGLSDLSFMQRHLELYLHWECPLFAMVDKEAFTRDFVTGGEKYCSPALVAAILALATPLRDGESGSESMSSGYSAATFASAARRLLRESTEAHALTKVQALALLSLREVSEGHLHEARTMATKCFEHIIPLCAAEMGTNKEGRYDATALAATFNGVISLARMITITACQLPRSASASPGGSAEDHKSPLDSHPPPLTNTDAMAHWSQLARKQAYPPAEASLLFQLTELVYSCLAYVHRSEPAARQQAVVYAYQKCLAWYSNTIATMEPETACTPSALFMHIFYHFCLLALFRPLLDSATSANSNVNASADPTPPTTAMVTNTTASSPSLSLHLPLTGLSLPTAMPSGPATPGLPANLNLPFALPVVPAAELSPRTICAEAAEAILALAEAHRTMFGPHRAPAFLRLFVESARAAKDELQGLIDEETGGGGKTKRRYQRGAGSSAGITLAAVERAIGSDAGYATGSVDGFGGSDGLHIGTELMEGHSGGLGIGGLDEEYLLP